jgi:hypothetical protein
MIDTHRKLNMNDLEDDTSEKRDQILDAKDSEQAHGGSGSPQFE